MPIKIDMAARQEGKSEEKSSYLPGAVRTSSSPRPPPVTRNVQRRTVGESIFDFQSLVS